MPVDSCVLVIDDDPVQRDLMQRFLTKEGFYARTAAGGEAGLGMARELRPVAITLDVMMPEMDGWSVLSALKSDAALRDIPVMMVTMVDDPERGFTLGAADYITKPVDRQHLSRDPQEIYLSQPALPGSPGRGRSGNANHDAQDFGKGRLEGYRGGTWPRRPCLHGAGTPQPHFAGSDDAGNGRIRIRRAGPRASRMARDSYRSRNRQRPDRQRSDNGLMVTLRPFCARRATRVQHY